MISTGIEPARPRRDGVSKLREGDLPMDRTVDEKPYPPPAPAPPQDGEEDASQSFGPMPSLEDLGVDPHATDALLPHLDSFVKWEVLRFLTANPETIATVEDLARYTGRDETELKPSAQALSGAGLLHQVEAMEQEIGSGYAYSLTQDERLRGYATHLAEGFQEDRLIRLLVSSHILKAQKESGKASSLSA